MSLRIIFFVWEFADAESNVFSKGRLKPYFTWL